MSKSSKKRKKKTFSETSAKNNEISLERNNQITYTQKRRGNAMFEYEKTYIDEDGQFGLAEVENYYPVASDYGKIPNRFIEKYGNISYLANLGLMLAVQKIEKRSKEMYKGSEEGAFYEQVYKETSADFADGLVSCIPIQQFIRLYNLNKGGKTYSNIDTLYNGTQLKNQWQILYEDDDKIVSTSVLTATMYNKKNKCLYMKFNPDLEPIILNIKKDYAQISLPVLGKLREDYITNMYQIFKRRYDNEQSKNKKYGYPIPNEIRIALDIDQFYFLAGIFPIDLDSQEKNMKMAIELLRKQNYTGAAEILRTENIVASTPSINSKLSAVKSFNYFKRHYLEKAFKSINGFSMIKGLEKPEDKNFFDAFSKYERLCSMIYPTDIHFRYELRKAGKGGKISEIVFYVRKTKWDNVYTTGTKSTVDQFTPEQEDFINNIVKILNAEDVSKADAESLAKASEWSMEVIERAYMAAKQQMEKKEIDFIPFMLKAVKEKWKPNKQTVKPDKMDAEEEYTKEFLNEKYGREDVLTVWKNNTGGKCFDLFVDVIYTTLNSDVEKISIDDNTRLAAKVVKQRLLDLDSEDVQEAISTYLKYAKMSTNTGEMVSTRYILKILYNIKQQRLFGQLKSEFDEEIEERNERLRAKRNIEE